MARGFMSFMRGVDITWAIGRVGLKGEPVLGPEIARVTASAIWAQNRPIELPQVMDTAAYIQCHTGPYKLHPLMVIFCTRVPNKKRF